MGDAREEAEKPWRRAELFETLAHPTRVRILRVLEKQPLSFADLKRVETCNTIWGNWVT
jgi:hypothetical protein